VHSFAVMRRPLTGSATTPKRTPNAGGELLVDRAQLLTLTGPEMTVLIGGLRALNLTSAFQTRRLHQPAETLTNDSSSTAHMNTKWQASSNPKRV